MFARVKKSGKYQYLQIVENKKEKGKVKQRVIATVGRMDQLREKDRVETLIRSLSRFSQKSVDDLVGAKRSERRCPYHWSCIGISAIVERKRCRGLYQKAAHRAKIRI